MLCFIELYLSHKLIIFAVYSSTLQFIDVILMADLLYNHIIVCTCNIFWIRKLKGAHSNIQVEIELNNENNCKKTTGN